MKIQKSFDSTLAGTLYVVPTPIGNLEDITYRALKTLQSASIIAAEDTRNTKKLLNHFEISTPLISYHEHNKLARGDHLLQRLANGETIAIVSDAGMPAISDPGFDLVTAAIEADYPVIVLPGANAALCALVGSGLPATEFLFYGFLPRKKHDKEEELERLKQLTATLLFYESPYRIKDTLKTIKKLLGNRQIAVARELTKRFEEYVRGTVDELILWSEERDMKGEFCLVVQGADPSESSVNDSNMNDLWWQSLSIKDHVIHYINNELLSSKVAIKRVAMERNIPKREVYEAYHING